MIRWLKAKWLRLFPAFVPGEKFPVGQIIYRHDGKKWAAFARCPEKDMEL